MPELRENHMLVQPNVLVDAEYNLTKYQNNIVLMGLGLLDTNIVHREEDGITFDIEDLYQYTKSKLRKDRFIQIIKDALRDLSGLCLTLVNPVTNDFKVIPWLAELDGNFKTTKVTIYFNKRLLQRFSKLEGSYTQCLLQNIMLLQTAYSKRIYQYALQYKPPQYEIPEISIEKFRLMLALDYKAKDGVISKHIEYRDLKRRVLMPAIKDINKNTDITINVNPVYQGKTIVALQFTYKFKSKAHEDVYKPKSKKSYKRSNKKRSQRPALPGRSAASNAGELAMQATLKKSGIKY